MSQSLILMALTNPYLRHILYDRTGGDVAGTHSGQFPCKARQRHGGKFVQNEMDMVGQSPVMDLICTVVKGLKRLGVKQAH